MILVWWVILNAMAALGAQKADLAARRRHGDTERNFQPTTAAWQNRSSFHAVVVRLEPIFNINMFFLFFF